MKIRPFDAEFGRRLETPKLLLIAVEKEFRERWNISQLRAYQIALMSEEKAYAFYDQALHWVTQPDVKALFAELREEEAEHVHMLRDLIAKLPPSAASGLEDLDTDPYKPPRDREPY